MSSNPPPIADPEDLLGTYAFLPWLRQGVANAITAPPASGLAPRSRWKSMSMERL